jgi:sulfopyruvate decarboxylase subunit beta
MTMKRDEVLKVLAGHVGDDIVVGVYQSLFDWMAIAPRDLNYLSTGAMGQASSHALGLALGRPDRRVLVLDGDGSLLMNLGSLVTVAAAAPENFYHFVFVNGCYEVNGAHAIPGGRCTDFAGLARAAGYAHAIGCVDLADFKARIATILAARGPVFAALAVEAGAAYPRDYDAIHSAEARDRFRTALRALPKPD